MKTYLETTSVLNDVVGGGVDSALSDGLGDQEEVVSLWQGDHIIHHSSTWWVAWSSVHLEEP